MRNMKMIWTLAFVAVLALALPANAAMIGANFIGNASGSSLATTDVAGVVPQDDWNNMAGTNAAPVVLNDDTGAATTATLTWSSLGTSSVKTAHGTYNPTTGTEKLMNGFIFGGGNSTIVTVTVGSIPVEYQASGYEAYIYANPNTWPTEITVGGTDWYTTGDLFDAPGYLDDYYEITSHDPANPTPYGNYVHVVGLDAASFSFTVSPTDAAKYCGAFGVQIVQVPEPGTLALVIAGGLAMLARRKRQA